MSRALPITQRQAQTLLRAAEAEKAIVEVKVGATVIRLIPATLAQEERAIDARLHGRGFLADDGEENFDAD